MTRQIFINLPVADLPKSKAFYEALGFTNNPQFTDATAACMVWSDAIHVMLLSHNKWKTFTDRPMCPAGSSEVALCIAMDSREAVNTITDIAGRTGGTAGVNPDQDHGFMFGRSFTDPDGHVWEPMWMDMDAFAAMQADTGAPQTA